MTRRLLPLLSLVLLTSALPAQISLFDWTLAGAPSGTGMQTATSLFVTGPDNGGCSVKITYFEAVASVGGTVSVTADFQNLDSGAAQMHPDFDAPAAYLNGNILTAPQVGTFDGWPTGTYTLQLVLNAGDVFGFGVWSLDCFEGPGVAEFHDLVFTPDPWSEQVVGLDPRVRFSFAGKAPFGKATAAAGAGDVDGDGVPDVVIGSSGAAVVRSGATGTILHTFTGSPAGEYGAAVSSAGDVDGDGHDDVLVGAPGDFSPLSQAGSAWVYSGDDGSVLYEYHGAATFVQLGNQVLGLGDVDGDDLGDFAIALDVIFDSHLERVLVVSGATGTVLHTLMTPGPNLDFGFNLGRVGDVDDDGHDDIGIGSDAGARIYSGDSGSLITVLGAVLGDRVAVDGAGDVNGDGFDDVVVGGAKFMVAGNQVGGVVVYSGADSSKLLTILGTEPGSGFGTKVAGGGDLDGDGRLDIAVSAPTVGLGGRVQVFDALDGSLRGTLLASGEDDGLGTFLDRLGDVDGDGHDDLLVSAPNGGLDTQGFVRVYQKLHRAGPPKLDGAGTLVAGQPLLISLTDALPDALTWFVLGNAYLGTPFLGGTLGPVPSDFRLYITDGAGALQLGALWPAGVPSGSTLWLQAWVTDPDAPEGYSGSNALGASQL